MKRISFEGNAFAEFTAWSHDDKRVFQKIATLLEECRRTPFHGTGKPEPLKHGAYRGYWSRRITEEHRLIYRVTDEDVFIAACKGHYGQ
jgi:toxin YoeB